MRTMATIIALGMTFALAAAAAERPALPPGEDAAKSALESSPRHGEWVDVDGVNTWVVYPERKDKAPVVIVIHEIFGLTDWVRSVADTLAAEGFIALAPDLLSGKGPSGGGSASVASRDDRVKLVAGLAADEVTTRLDAVRKYGLALPAADGHSAVIGFCWGGSRSFAYAASQPGLDAAVVYYGTAPTEASAIEAIRAPVLGLYGGDDARVGATIDATVSSMKAAGKSYEPLSYEGAGHGFLRAQSGREGANMKAAESAWPRTIAFLREHTH